MPTTSTGFTRNIDPVTVYVRLRNPEEDTDTAYGDLRSAIDMDDLIRKYLLLKGCKKIYVNLTGVNYILRVSYIPAHCKPEVLLSNFKEILNDCKCELFNTYAEAKGTPEE